MGCGVSGPAMAATGREKSGKGESAPARESLGRIRGCDADVRADGRAGTARRRPVSRPIERDCPLPAAETAVYTFILYWIGKTEDSARDHNIYYYESSIKAIRLNQWKMSFETSENYYAPYEKQKFPILINLRFDPFE